jgi:hypothetical protein
VASLHITLHSPDWLPFPGGIVFIVKHGGRLVDERSPFKFPFFFFFLLRDTTAPEPIATTDRYVLYVPG